MRRGSARTMTIPPSLRNAATRRETLSLLGAAALAACAGGAGPDRTLRVADQLQYLQALFGASGQNRDDPRYHVEWSNFVSGPAVISAATGGSIDLGWMATTPLVFAQSAGSPVKVVAAYRAVPSPDGVSAMAIVVRPGSPIRSLANLKGKRLCYALGTITQYLAYQALQSVGLDFDDVQSVTSTVALAGQLLANDRTDALVAVEPLLSTMVQTGDARIIARGTDIVPEIHYLVAPTEALGRPDTTSFIGDFLDRTGKAMQWWQDNPQAAVREAAQLYKVPEPVAATIARHIGRKAVPITPDIIAFQQQQADVFHALGQIATRIDVGTIFDRRFDKVGGDHV